MFFIYPATDIASLLCSKYGIKISIDDVQNFILEGYNVGHSTEEVLDLSEIVSILIIPYLLKKIKGFKEAGDDDGATRTRSGVHDVLKEVLGVILIEVTGSETPKELNTELLSKIFAHYGEYELSSNHELLGDMVRLASPSTTGESVLLDAKTFGEALTNDVLLFSNEKEVKYALAKILDNLYEDPGNAPDIEEMDVTFQDVRHRVKSFRTVFTAPAIDLVIDSVHSLKLVVLLWSGFLVSFFTYTYRKVNYKVELCPDQGSICVMGETVLIWILKMLCFV